MESAKKSVELNLIKPIFIGNKQEINEKAEKIKWDINAYEIINSSNDVEASIIGAELGRDNKIKIMIKGNLHTDVLMKTYLKKEFGLLEGKRLSHIWHMTILKDDKPLFITDGALMLLLVSMLKCIYLKMLLNLQTKLTFQNQE
jgi:Phosphotransacetylase